MGSKLHNHLLNVIPIERELGRRSFHEFVKMAWPAIDPADFVDGWHIELICEYLEKCYRRELRRFIINIPPRHCKSSIVSVLFPAWCWINDPKLKFFLFSYAMKLCERDTVKCRRLIQSEWFRDRWGDTVQLMEDQNQVRKYETTVGGVRTISSVAGPVTGEGGDFLICFPYDEFVWTNQGKIKIGKIVEEKMDVSVWSQNTDTGHISLRKIDGWIKNPSSSILEIQFSNGNSIQCTPDHRIWTNNRGWVHAKDLMSFDVLPCFSFADEPNCVNRHSKFLRNFFTRKFRCSNVLNIFSHIKSWISLSWRGFKNLTSIYKRFPTSQCNSGDTFNSSQRRNFIQSFISRECSPLFVCNVGHSSSTYCLNVSENHTFIVGDRQGILVRNCDDPHNVIEGESEAVRDSTVQWWSEAVSSRLNDERTGVKIIIQQRVHELDLSGEMIRAGYNHLVLPFEFEENHPFRHPRDIRTNDGEILWKAKFGNEEVQRKKGELGSYAYAGQYQQRPAPREGGMFEEKWFLAHGVIINPWEVPEGGITVGGWDIAASNTKGSAYTCRVKMKKVNGAYYILDVLRWKLSPGKLERRVQDTVTGDGLYVHRHSFPQDPGAAGKIVARNWKVLLAGYPIRYTPESGSKENRAMSFAAQVEIGNVHLVKGSWIQKYITECCTFPNGRYKDQVDASSRAFHEILSIERNGVDGGDIGKTLEIALLQSEHPSVGFYKDWEYTEMPKDETPLVAAPIG